jgi:hypothetical protein
MLNLKKTAALALITVSSIFAGCSSDADIASHNLSKAADQFEVQRRVVFYNGITGEYILTVEGLCSIGNERDTSRVSIICKTSPSDYKKHFLGLSDNVTYFAEQLEANKTSTYHYKVIFKPSSIVPDVDVKM